MLQPSSDQSVSDLCGNARDVRTAQQAGRQQDAVVELEVSPTASIGGCFGGAIRTIANPMVDRGNPMSVMGCWVGLGSRKEEETHQGTWSSGEAGTSDADGRAWARVPQPAR